MKNRFSLVALVGAFCSLVFSACSLNSPGGGIDSYQGYNIRAKLPEDPGAVSVKVSLSRQRVYVLEGDKVLLVMPVSVGEAVTPTPTGSFRIYNKDKRHRAADDGYATDGKEVRRMKLSSRPSGWRFKGTPLPYWCEFKDGYGFHTGWVKHTPCTNGSIRMHENLAPKFFRLVSEGTPVSISYRQVEDAEWDGLSLPPDAGPLADYPGEVYFGEDYFSQHKAPKFD